MLGIKELGIKEIITRVRGGANVPHFKNTAESESVKMPSPPVVVLPLQQHKAFGCKRGGL